MSSGNSYQPSAIRDQGSGACAVSPTADLRVAVGESWDFTFRCACCQKHTRVTRSGVGYTKCAHCKALAYHVIPSGPAAAIRPIRDEPRVVCGMCGHEYPTGTLGCPACERKGVRP